MVAGVAARAGEQRNEEREDDDLIESVLIDFEDLDGEDRGHGEDEQPHDAALDQTDDGRGQVGTVQRLRTGTAGEVLRVLLVDDVEDVIHGEDADEPFLLIGHGHRDEPVGEEFTRGFLTVGQRMGAQRITHHVRDDRVLIGGEEVAQ